MTGTQTLYIISHNKNKDIWLLQMGSGGDYIQHEYKDLISAITMVEDLRK